MVGHTSGNGFITNIEAGPLNENTEITVRFNDATTAVFTFGDFAGKYTNEYGGVWLLD